MGGIAIRRARPGDGQALARIHADMAAYYVERFPEHFRMPRLAGLEDELDAELGERGDSALKLVAEVDGEVVGVLVARVLAPEEGAEREIVPELGERRLRIDYLAQTGGISGAASALDSLMRQRAGAGSTARRLARRGRTRAARCRCRSGRSGWAMRRAQ